MSFAWGQEAHRAPVERARLLYRERRIRARHFPARLFAEPAWDILLDLYIAHAEDRAVSVSSACIAAAVPPTTALRTLGVLADFGLLHRDPHRDDARSTLVRLTDAAIAAIETYLGAIDSDALQARRQPVTPPA